VESPGAQLKSSMVLISDAPSESGASLSFYPREMSSIHSPATVPEMLASEVKSRLW
jgi:hypothetical protein